MEHPLLEKPSTEEADETLNPDTLLTLFRYSAPDALLLLVAFTAGLLHKNVLLFCQCPFFHLVRSRLAERSYGKVRPQVFSFKMVWECLCVFLSCVDQLILLRAGSKVLERLL